VLAGASRSLALTPRLYLSGELSATFSYIDAHPDGASRLEFTVRNPALHAQVGMGYRF
jgi:hypothetical protein